MTRDKIFVSVESIFRDIFDDENLRIQNSTNSDSVEDWDSLNHVNLISAIEKEFNIRFALGELTDLKDVGGIIDLIEEKTAWTEGYCFSAFALEDILIAGGENSNVV